MNDNEFPSKLINLRQLLAAKAAKCSLGISWQLLAAKAAKYSLGISRQLCSQAAM